LCSREFYASADAGVRSNIFDITTISPINEILEFGVKHSGADSAARFFTCAGMLDEASCLAASTECRPGSTEIPLPAFSRRVRDSAAVSGTGRRAQLTSQEAW
jgi:hypothetical protein